MDKALTRRLLTVTVLVLAFALLSLLLPVLLLVALGVDLYRYAKDRTPAMAARIVAFGWAYLFGEAVAVLALAAVLLFGKARSLSATYRLQNVWAAWNYNAFRSIFNVRFEVEGEDAAVPAPLVILARHASLIDSLLPIMFVGRAHRMRLRYVLKQELLADPALDIAGNRLPNHFIDRRSKDFDSELTSLRDLASNLGADEGVVIFPEGTRYSERKRAKVAARHEGRAGVISALSRSYRRVLPPKPSGTLALLAATTADVLVLAHRGLEGFARVADIWKGGLVGSRISVGMWRVPRSAVPSGRAEQIEWLYKTWADVDTWITSRELAIGEPAVSR